MQTAMVKHFLERRSEAGEGLEVLPGVVDLLNILKDNDDVSICLCTGNLEPIAWEKMANLGIKDLFTEPFFGGFGSDFCSGNTEESWKDRSELIKIAAARAAELVGEEPVCRFHVGDAPMDVQAAHSAGAVPIGVLTGIYTEENLRSACSNAIVLQDLCDISQVLSTLNLS
jgi:phosphoglycolate phosphatase-like HAD superfamily hydrolase